MRKVNIESDKIDAMKFADPNYHGYSQLLYEKKNEEILQQLIKRLQLNEQPLNEVRQYASK